MRIRQSSVDALHGRFGDTTRAWMPTDPDDALGRYAVKHGVAHLLWTERKDDAEQRMLDLHFMAAFADAWPSVVEPLAAWRAVGLEAARVGFESLAQDLDPPGRANLELIESVKNVGNFLFGAGLYRPSFTLTCWYRDSHATHAGSNAEQTLRATMRLGSIALRMGQYEIAELELTRAEKKSRQCDVATQRDLRVEVLGSIGGLWFSLGDYSRSRSLYEESLALLTEVGREREPYAHVIRLDIANVAWRMDQENEGISIIRGVIKEVEEEANDPVEHHIWPSWRRLAMALNLLGAVEDNPVEEEQHYARALAIRETNLGPAHPETLVCAHNLANVKGRLGEADYAILLYRRVYEGRLSAFGALHAETLQTLCCLGKELLEQGDDSGREMIFEAASGRKTLLGADHPATLSNQYDIAVMLLEQEEHEQAEELLRSVLSSQERVMGPFHTVTLQSMWALATCCHSLGKVDESLSLSRACLTATRTQFGDTDDRTLHILSGFATNICDQPETQQEAEDLYLELVKLRLKVDGPNGKNTLRAQSNLALLYFHTERVADARELWELVYLRQCDALESTDPDKVDVAAHLLRLEYAGGDHSTVLHWAEALVHCNAECHGEDAMEVVQALYYLGLLLEEFEQLDKALATFLRVLKIEQVLFGDCSSECAQTHYQIADIFRALGRAAEAVTHRCACLAIESAAQTPVSGEVLETAQALADDHCAADEPDAAISLLKNWLSVANRCEETEELAEAIEETQQQLKHLTD